MLFFILFLKKILYLKSINLGVLTYETIRGILCLRHTFYSFNVRKKNITIY